MSITATFLGGALACGGGQSRNIHLELIPLQYWPFCKTPSMKAALQTCVETQWSIIQTDIYTTEQTLQPDEKYKKDF